MIKSKIKLSEEDKKALDISKSQDKGDLGGHIIKGVEPKLKWYQRILNWLIKLFKEAH